jgi:hypothetical protein
MLKGSPVLCAHCKREQAVELDHDPPLAMHKHRENTQCCRLIPSCRACNRGGGRLVASGRWRPGIDVSPLELEPERDGLGVGDRRWRVGWLAGLRTPPPDAVWPRLMTVPHPAAVGSLGAEFSAWAEDRSGRPLRWWQQLVAARLLEVDDAGALVWPAALLSMSRQLGKSWFLRELCLWRIHQGGRFGEPQDVLHTGKDLAVCKEVQRPARIWAKARGDTYRVREVNGQEEIEVLADGSRWMLRAKEAVYGYSVSMAAADEAWKVRESSIEEGLAPTMVERVQPQLVLVSTAHRSATSLMIGRRQAALAALESGDGDLLVEWSAPAGVEVDDVAGWRAASPHWTPQRERLIERQLAKMRAGEIDDPEEPDPVASFRAQWLNIWPRGALPSTGNTEALLPAGCWAAAESPGVGSAGPVWVAVEDDVGYGAAVAAAGRLPDGRLEVDGWLRADWESAMADVAALAALRPIRHLSVGASLADRVPTGIGPAPKLAAAKETRVGLAILRDLAVSGGLAHDNTPDLDEALGLARVRETATGLVLVAAGPIHLIKALVWATAAAARPARIPVVH